ncbi:MAG: hypothetical protein C0602_02645 [Denitrovibrio sp.]|nr:MAG: hypothetical protein C0602_02645 [Denitrovibrio sp.]
MEYKINENEDGIEISISDVKDDKEKLLKAFQECSEGRCTCKTDEYQKLESLEIGQSEDGISINLKSKTGEKLDVSEINKCLIQTSQDINK